MTTESTLKRQNGTRYALIIIISHLNVCPNNQLQAESEVAHFTSFLAMPRPLHSITNEEQYKNLSIQKIRVEIMHCQRAAISHYHKSTSSIVCDKVWNDS